MLQKWLTHAVENKINPDLTAHFRPRIATAPPQPDRPWHPVGHQHLLLRHSVPGQAGSAGQDPLHGLPRHFPPPQGFGVRAGQRERHLSLPTHSQAFQDHRWVWVCIDATHLIHIAGVSQCVSQAHKFENVLTPKVTLLATTYVPMFDQLIIHRPEDLG